MNERLHILDFSRKIREHIQTRELLGSKLYSRRHTADLEWLVLGYLVGLLSPTDANVPKFAKRTESETDLARNEPDFWLYADPEASAPTKKVEITHVFEPGSKPKLESEELERLGMVRVDQANDPSLVWETFFECLNRKLAKRYARGCWLAIYLNWSYRKWAGQELKPWHEMVLSAAKRYRHADTCGTLEELSRYDAIYVISTDCKGMVRLHPHWDVIAESAAN